MGSHTTRKQISFGIILCELISRLEADSEELICARVYTLHVHIHVLMRDERRKEEISKQSQTNNQAKQHSTPKAVTFPKKNELPQVGLEPTTL